MHRADRGASLPPLDPGAVEASYRVFAGDAAAGAMLGSFVVPAALGNAVGGIFLVALLSYAQVATDEEADR